MCAWDFSLLWGREEVGRRKEEIEKANKRTKADKHIGVVPHILQSKEESSANAPSSSQANTELDIWTSHNSTCHLLALPLTGQDCSVKIVGFSGSDHTMYRTALPLTGRNAQLRMRVFPDQTTACTACTTATLHDFGPFYPIFWASAFFPLKRISLTVLIWYSCR